MLSGKTILVGITGAIAAYKTLELIRMFKREGANVRVVVTPNAFEFVTETTLQSLSQNQVYVEQFKIGEYKPEHIALSEADIFLIAPITANTIGKLVYGVCDNLLTSVACAYKNKIIIAPCMNTVMWENESVQDNIKTLKARDFIIVEPASGFLACGDTGKGRLADLNDIFETVKSELLQAFLLKGKKIVITAGGTKEDIDPVRYIGNHSSGKMGLALADNAHKMGAEVILISTFNVDRKYPVIKVNTAVQMFEEVKTQTKTADSLIMAAAVSDYRVKNQSREKIKKDDNENLSLELIKNPDILEYASKNKNENQIIVGFCAESENLLENARKKITKKQCDYIVANDISKSDVGFCSDYNEVYILDKDNDVVHIQKNTKNIVAKKILEKIYG